jgi:hypothetical protein
MQPAARVDLGFSFRTWIFVPAGGHEFAERNYFSEPAGRSERRVQCLLGDQKPVEIGRPVGGFQRFQ